MMGGVFQGLASRRRMGRCAKPTLLMALLLLSSALACGDGDASEEARLEPLTGEAGAPGSQVGGEAPVPSLAEPDEEMEQFLREYEALIDDYCQFADRFAEASMAEKVEMADELVEQGTRLSTFTTRALTLRASFSTPTKDRLEALQARADTCGEKFGG